MARRLVLLVLVALVTWGAAPPDTQAENAEKLHELAKAAYADGRYIEAIQLWEEAEELNPHWKYAYNQANCLYEESRYIEALAALRRTEKLGLPSKYFGHLAELHARVKAALLSDHAEIKLQVEPATAHVTRNGLPWAAPRSFWTQAGESRIVVTQEGFEPSAFIWNHPIGRQHTKRIILRELQRTGSLVVKGGPPGAEVRVGGRAVGTLPLEAPVHELKPGMHTVRVSLADHEPVELQVRVKAGATAELVVTLERAASPHGAPQVGVEADLDPEKPGPEVDPDPAEPEVGVGPDPEESGVEVDPDPSAPAVEEGGTPPEPGGRGLRIAGWTGVSLGLAALGSGVAMFVRAGGIRGDIDTLNANSAEFLESASGGTTEGDAYAAYLAEAQPMEDDYDEAVMLGYVLTGVGAALGIVGAVLLVVGEPGSEDASEGPEAFFGPMVLPAGGGFQFVLRF